MSKFTIATEFKDTFQKLKIPILTLCEGEDQSYMPDKLLVQHFWFIITIAPA